MITNATTEDMKTLVSCHNKLFRDGYTENFQVSGNALHSMEKGKDYKPEDVRIVNFFRFEGASDPADNSILYAIEANDGVKGTITDAYGPYADPVTDNFIKQVEDIGKKTKKNH
jgi:hypothetical protein